MYFELSLTVLFFPFAVQFLRIGKRIQFPFGKGGVIYIFLGEISIFLGSRFRLNIHLEKWNLGNFRKNLIENGNVSSRAGGCWRCFISLFTSVPS